MSIPGSANPLLLKSAAAATYSISRSLRFNAPDSAYLSRTPASAGNRKTWTWAGWVKRSTVGTGDQMIFSSGTSGYTTSGVIFFRNDAFCYSSLAADVLVTSALYRDPAAWYHFVVAFDSTQATASSRLRFYVNGTEVTQFSTDARAAQITQNTDYGINLNQTHEIGRFTADSSRYFSGYLADIHFIDGQALTPTSFGEFDTNGIWQPKAFSGGTYGTNGFRLPFSNNASTTTISQDSSGNNNHWTANNISVTAGAGNDSLVDSPTNGTASSGGDAGGTTTGNYCTWNPLDSLAGTLSNGNLDSTSSGSGIKRGTIGVSSGKWYWEVTITSAADRNIGIARLDSALTASTVGAVTGQVGYYCSQAFPPSPLAGTKYVNGSSSTYGAYYYSGDTIGIALDLDAGQVTFYVNGVSQGVAATGLTGTWTAAHSAGSGAGANMTANFGARPFAYAAPAGFRSLNTANLPTPTILKGSSYFDTKLYTGNGSTQTISGLGFSPDLVWLKSRTNANWHELNDTVRGAGKILYSNTTNAEATVGTFTAFNSDGFSVSTTGGDGTNFLNAAMVAWCWDAGSSTVTNTSGTISSQVRANPSAGVSIVSYTGTGANATVGHGLGVAPQMIIVKTRSFGNSWKIYHVGLTSAAYNLEFTTGAQLNEPQSWNSTAPTSTVFSVGTQTSTNQSSGTQVAYCFAPVAGFSAFGSYTGNGSATDGPFVYTGHRSRWLMIKCSSIGDSFQHWVLFDSARNTYNLTNLRLIANDSTQEQTFGVLDILSNGFKIRYTDSYFNQNGSTWIWASFAENPFSIARAR